MSAHLPSVAVTAAARSLYRFVTTDATAAAPGLFMSFHGESSIGNGSETEGHSEEL